MHVLLSGFHFYGTNFVFYRENEDPNHHIVNTLLKEIQEVDQIKNDTLCTQRRVLGKFLCMWGPEDSLESHICAHQIF